MSELLLLALLTNGLAKERNQWLFTGIHPVRHLVGRLRGAALVSHICPEMTEEQVESILGSRYRLYVSGWACTWNYDELGVTVRWSRPVVAYRPVGRLLLVLVDSVGSTPSCFLQVFTFKLIAGPWGPPTTLRGVSWRCMGLSVEIEFNTVPQGATSRPASPR